MSQKVAELNNLQEYEAHRLPTLSMEPRKTSTEGRVQQRASLTADRYKARFESQFGDIKVSS